ncbi:MAG: hypothetical protein M5R42_12095 [Rhodocyclaceae bacterium]|nr:hypothetical protein [Rhodocyclaceae bacterium]
MAMFHVQGCDLSVALAAQAGQLELNVMMPVIPRPGYRLTLQPDEWQKPG